MAALINQFELNQYGCEYYCGEEDDPESREQSLVQRDPMLHYDAIYKPKKTVSIVDNRERTASTTSMVKSNTLKALDSSFKSNVQHRLKKVSDVDAMRRQSIPAFNP